MLQFLTYLIQHMLRFPISICLYCTKNERLFAAASKSKLWFLSLVLKPWLRGRGRGCRAVVGSARVVPSPQPRKQVAMHSRRDAKPMDQPARYRRALSGVSDRISASVSVKASAGFGSGGIGSTRCGMATISPGTSITSISIQSSTVTRPVCRIGPIPRFAAG